jgi:hypothetical protein
MATGPQPGDLIIRTTLNAQFDVVTADGRHLAGPFDSFLTAHVCARVEAKGAFVWQQVTDLRGRPLGDPTLVPVTPHKPL